MLYNAMVPLEDGYRHLQHLQTPHMVPLNVGITAAVGEIMQPSVLLFLFGKLINGGDFLNTIPADSTSTNLIFLRNILSLFRFLVDTGASVSVFPHRPCSPSSPGVGVQLRWIHMEPAV